MSFPSGSLKTPTIQADGSAGRSDLATFWRVNVSPVEDFGVAHSHMGSSLEWNKRMLSAEQRRRLLEVRRSLSPTLTPRETLTSLLRTVSETVGTKVALLGHKKTGWTILVESSREPSLASALMSRGVVEQLESALDGSVTVWSDGPRRWTAVGLSLHASVRGVIVLGVEEGIVTGVVVSLAVLVWRSSHPHMAIVGRVPGTEHFRNVERHQVETLPDVIALRIDESIYFATCRTFIDNIDDRAKEKNNSERRRPTHCSRIVIASRKSSESY